MAGKIFLEGGGDEKQSFTVEEVFLEGVERVLYVPVAWPNDDFDSCLNWFRGNMASHKKVDIEMLTDLRDANLGGFDGVYIGGGNTFKLLKRIRESGFDKKLLKFYQGGGRIAGGSAGAIVFGYDIGTALLCKDADVNKVGLKDLRGMNQVGGCDIQAHFEDDQIKEHKDYIAKTGRRVVGVPEESALEVGGSKYLVVGKKPITLISRDGYKVFEVGEEVKL